MALTSEEESKVRSIIEAFENGKRLADLPEVEGTNPFELLCEVLDTDGESKKAALATFMPYLEENCAYGIEYDVTVSSPECTRIGNMELHKSLPIQSRMKGCLLADDGTVTEYLNPADWRGNTRDVLPQVRDRGQQAQGQDFGISPARLSSGKEEIRLRL